MMKGKWMSLGTLAAALLLAGMAVAAPGSPSIDWWVMGSGGGSGAANGSTLDGTVGQVMAGVDGSGDTVLCTGFWCNGELICPPGHSLYLPMVLRNAP
jgi:hypothetical protein